MPSSLTTGFYNPKTFITHAALLRQAFAHCARFPTAASRRSLDRVSVPVWPDRPLRPATDRSLGEPLPHQLTNQTQDSLSALGLTIPSFHLSHPSDRSHAVLPLLSERYSPLRGKFPTCYSPVCHVSCDTSDLHV